MDLCIWPNVVVVSETKISCTLSSIFKPGGLVRRQEAILDPGTKFRFCFAIIGDVGLKITGFEDCPDWPKMGPSLLIATCLILAIRTAKWAARSDNTASNMDLEKEIDHAAFLAGRVLAKLVARNPSLFPQAQKAWYQPDGEDEPK